MCTIMMIIMAIDDWQQFHYWGGGAGGNSLVEKLQMVGLRRPFETEHRGSAMVDARIVVAYDDNCCCHDYCVANNDNIYGSSTMIPFGR